MSFELCRFKSLAIILIFKKLVQYWLFLDMSWIFNWIRFPLICVTAQLKLSIPSFTNSGYAKLILFELMNNSFIKLFHSYIFPPINEIFIFMFLKRFVFFHFRKKNYMLQIKRNYWICLLSCKNAISFIQNNISNRYDM